MEFLVRRLCRLAEQEGEFQGGLTEEEGSPEEDSEEGDFEDSEEGDEGDCKKPQETEQTTMSCGMRVRVRYLVQDDSCTSWTPC